MFLLNRNWIFITCGAFNTTQTSASLVSLRKGENNALLFTSFSLRVQTSEKKLRLLLVISRKEKDCRASYNISKEEYRLMKHKE